VRYSRIALCGDGDFECLGLGRFQRGLCGLRRRRHESPGIDRPLIGNRRLNALFGQIPGHPLGPSRHPARSAADARQGTCRCHFLQRPSTDRETKVRAMKHRTDANGNTDSPTSITFRQPPATMVMAKSRAQVFRTHWVLAMSVSKGFSIAGISIKASAQSIAMPKAVTINAMTLMVLSRLTRLTDVLPLSHQGTKPMKIRQLSVHDPAGRIIRPEMPPSPDRGANAAPRVSACPARRAEG